MSELPEAGVAGPLAVYVDGFRSELAGLGFSPRTVRDHGYVLAQLSRWVAAVGISPGQLTEPVLARFGRRAAAQGLPQVAVEAIAAAARGVPTAGGSDSARRAGAR